MLLMVDKWCDSVNLNKYESFTGMVDKWCGPPWRLYNFSQYSHCINFFFHHHPIIVTTILLLLFLKLQCWRNRWLQIKLYIVKGLFRWLCGKLGGWKISGRMKKLEDRKYIVFRMFGWRDGKVGGWKTFLFGWKEKWEDRKCSLYKLTIITLLHNR